MITITALDQVSIQVPESAKTDARSISLKLGEKATLNSDEFAQVRVYLDALKADKHLLYTGPANEFNALLDKLDSDTGVADTDYVATLSESE